MGSEQSYTHSIRESEAENSTKISKVKNGYEMTTTVSTVNDYEYEYLMHLIKDKSSVFNPHVLSVKGYQEKEKE